MLERFRYASSFSCFLVLPFAKLVRWFSIGNEGAMHGEMTSHLTYSQPTLMASDYSMLPRHPHQCLCKFCSWWKRVYTLALFTICTHGKDKSILSRHLHQFLWNFCYVPYGVCTIKGKQASWWSCKLRSVSFYVHLFDQTRTYYLNS